VISLLESTALQRHYVDGGLNLHPEGLLGYYRARGLCVESIECTDYIKPTADQMESVFQAFRRVPGPVLLHCSAAIDRTTPVAAFIVEKEQKRLALVDPLP
jgi:protein tyrosine/serine phosphatase